MNLKCEIDPQFRPKKGSQIQSLRNDVDELRSKIAFLTKNENLIAQVLQKTNIEGAEILAKNHGDNTDGNGENKNSISNNSGRGKENKMITPPLVAKTHLKKDPVLLSLDGKSNSIPLINDSAVNKEQLNVALKAAVRSVSESPATFTPSENINDASFNGKSVTTHVNTHAIPQNNISPNTHISEFVLGDVKISIEKAKTLHKNFVDNFLPYLPILISNDPIELYQQSQLLFWTPLPLPFYNQITKDDFTAITTTTPNGTTITKLVPTDQAIINAKESAFKAGLSMPTEINGIPLAMLEATGSISSKPSKVSLNRNDNISPRGKKNILKSSSSTNVSEQASLQVTKPTSSANLGKSKSRQYPPPPLFPNVSNEKISLTADALGMRKTSNSMAEADFKNGYQTSNLSSIPNVLEKGSQKMGSVDISNLDSLFDSPKLTNDPEGEPLNNRGGVRSSTETPEDIDPMNEMFIDSIFQQNSKPIEDDDLLGWFDMNMAPEF
ncbi:putative transcription factor SEF1 [Pichia kudriavzevii]|uniref:Putative transcription factor SEF1 n=1 Tax=Pichia kudriavzevii TaxID=4909 RepID=A0A1V2LU99_PICKU|nr:putative transcription factor SEF1 [Pichia kudriavzevii]